MCWRLVPMLCFPRSTMPGGQQPQKHYGITSAISHAPPREIDHQYTKKLCDAMKPFGVFEDEEELNHRWGTASIIVYITAQLLGILTAYLSLSNKGCIPKHEHL